METPMTRSARNSLVAVILCAASARAAAPVIPARPAAAPVIPAMSPKDSVEALVREAAQIEKSDGCEAAWLKYKEAGDKIPAKASGRFAQLQGVVANKMDKLETCYRGCQPNEKQRELFTTAKETADAEPHRASRILRQLLVGRSVDRCVFWSDARSLLRTLPGQAESLDKDQADPCAITPELQKALAEAHDAVRKERSAVGEMNYDRKKVAGKLADLADLYRTMDQTRMLLVDLREGLVECDSLSKQLAADNTALKESIGLAQDMVLGTYKSQLAALSSRVRSAQAALAQKDELLTAQIGEQEKLKKQFEGLAKLSEELYNDLFSLTQVESVSFSVEVEGRRVEQPIEEVRALVANEKKVMEVLSAKYPEYFKSGVNVEGLKRKKLVLEKLQQMMKHYGSRSEQRIGYSRALAEMDATLQMMDRAIGEEPKGTVAEEKPRKESTGAMPWFIGGGSILAIAGLTVLRIRASMKD
jgi:hypothetical protein